MTRRLSMLLLLAIATLTTPVRGEKASMSPDAMRKTATHVIVGEVVGVYERTETAGDWEYTRYVAEIRVSDSEKGDGIDDAGLVYARYWKRRWIRRT